MGNAYNKSLCIFHANSEMTKHVKSQEEFNVIRKNDLNSLQSECEILKLRKLFYLKILQKCKKKLVSPTNEISREKIQP